MTRTLTAVLAPLLALALLAAACGSTPSESESPAESGPVEPEPAYRSSSVADFQAMLAESRGPLVVALMSASCSPCIIELPIVDALSRELGLKVVGLSLDYSEDNLRYVLDKTGIGFPVYWTGEAALGPMGIKYLPLLILYKDGAEVERLEGLSDEARLREAFTALLGS